MKKGISLIVLIITIIIMIIIATVIITSISDSGIIDKAGEAKKKMNLASMTDAANYALSDVMLDENIPNEYINGNDIMNKMIKNGITDEQLDDYFILYDGKGVTVEEAPQLELTEEEAETLGWMVQDYDEENKSAELIYSGIKMKNDHTFTGTDIVVPCKIGDKQFVNSLYLEINISEECSEYYEAYITDEDGNVDEQKVPNIDITFSKGIEPMDDGLLYIEHFDLNIRNIKFTNAMQYIIDEIDIKYITLPNRLKKLYIYGNNTYISSLTMPNNVTDISLQSFVVGRLCLNDNVKYIKAPYIKENINIPSSINTLFANNFYRVDVKSLTIPNNIEKIEANVFDNCPNLESIVIENKNIIIEQNAFANCPKLISYTGPSQGLKGFNNSNIQKLNLTSLENTSLNAVCKNVNSIKEVILSEDITTIPYGFFGNCTNLEKVTLPNNMEEIKEYAFWYCSSLKELKLPNTLTEIGDGAFGMTGIKKLIIPNSVTTVTGPIFDGCVATPIMDVYVSWNQNNKPSGWYDDWDNGQRDIYYINDNNDTTECNLTIHYGTN